MKMQKLNTKTEDYDIMHQDILAGKTVLFQGDSITDCGRTDGAGELGAGYPQIVAQVYEALCPLGGARFINRGVSGNRSADLLARYEQDFAAVRPDFLSILIGINDTWRRYDSNDPTSAEAYEANYRELLTRIKRDLPQTKVMILEPFLIPTDPVKDVWQEDLGPKIQIARRLAREFADFFLPLDGIFQSCITAGMAPAALSEDGVHPTRMGAAVIARAYLETVGVL